LEESPLKKSNNLSKPQKLEKRKTTKENPGAELESQTRTPTARAGKKVINLPEKKK